MLQGPVPVVVIILDKKMHFLEFDLIDFMELPIKTSKIEISLMREYSVKVGFTVRDSALHLSGNSQIFLYIHSCQHQYFFFVIIHKINHINKE